MQVRSDKLQRYSSARSLVTTGRIFLDANERQSSESFASYGKRQNPALTKLLASNYGVPAECLLYDRGLDEIISLIFRACCESGSSVRIFTPTYGMYSIEAAIQNLKLDPLPLLNDGTLDLAGLKNNPGNPSLVILCRPNNPLGTFDSLETVIKLLDFYQDICPVFIDEAYIEFSDRNQNEMTELIFKYDLILGRTLSKAYGLAGLRFGSALASGEWIDRLATVQKPYPISKIVEDYLLTHFEASLRSNAESWINQVKLNRQSWIQFFSNILNTKPFSSQANFLCFKTPKAKVCYQFLLGKGIVTRIFGEDLIRITIGTKAQLDEIKLLDWQTSE